MSPRWYFLLPLAVLASACAQSTPESRGQATFTAFGCVKCHSIGHGGGVYGPDLTTIGFRKSPEWLHQWIKNPHAWKSTTVMPDFNLNDAIRGDLVAYLSAQKGQGWGDNRPWDGPELASDSVHRGEMLFNKAGCVACHGLAGAGGFPNNNFVGGKIPPLERVVEGYSRAELIQRISNGKKSDPADPSQPAPMVFMPRWKDLLKPADIEAVVDYLFSLQKGHEKSEW